MYVGLYVRYPLLLLYFNVTVNFLKIFSNSTQISNVMKIHLLRAESFFADSRTGRDDKAYSLLSQLVSAPV